MKKCKKIALFCLIFIIGIIILIYMSYIYRVNKLTGEISNYLAEHYNEQMEIQGVSVLENTALCNLMEDRNIRFNVFFYENSNSYKDTYLENKLAKEAENIFAKEIQKDFSDFSCLVNINARDEDTFERLYDFYAHNKRAMTWDDEECEETVQVYVVINSSLPDERYAKNLANRLKNMSIPCSSFFKIDKKTNDGKRVHLYP